MIFSQLSIKGQSMGNAVLKKERSELIDENIHILSPSILFGDLPLLKLRFSAKLTKQATLPPFLGSAWRGLIGWQLKKLVCPFDRKYVCKSCTIKEHCPYFMLFERESSLPGLMETPRGYIFYPSAYHNGNLELHITLIGSCVKFLPVLAKALFKGQGKGLGIGRFPYEIISWAEMLHGGKSNPLQLNPDAHQSSIGPYPVNSWLKKTPQCRDGFTIQLVTPVRLRKEGKYLGIMNWPFFFSCLARRLEALNCVFNEGSLFGKEIWKALQHQFESQDKIEYNLKWQDLYRYSKRQKRKIPMGGLVGSVTVPNPSPWFMEWWQVASLVHVGKGAAMGLGKINIL